MQATHLVTTCRDADNSEDSRCLGAYMLVRWVGGSEEGAEAASAAGPSYKFFGLYRPSTALLTLACADDRLEALMSQKSFMQAAKLQPSSAYGPFLCLSVAQPDFFPSVLKR